MLNRVFIVLIYIILFLSCENDSSDLNQNDDLVESEILWDDYVIFKTGNIPLLIIAPHGGDLKPQWLDDRNCENSKIVQDQYTLEIALQIEQELNTLGFQPFLVLSKMHRIKIDLNRSLETALCKDKSAMPLWVVFHNQIDIFRNEISSSYGRGLVIDLHGQSHPEQRIELGYLLNGQMLRDFEANSTDYSNQASIKSLISNNPQQVNFEQLIIGDNSLGTLLEFKGFDAVPSNSDQAPLEHQLFFSGGHNTINYGSRDSGSIDAIQVELNREGLRSEIEDRERFASVFSNILVDFLTIHYADALNP
tara:strand:- start:260 stop:1180 length:921 start_codon:yes stop_codon:yes gene_type:complete